MMLGVPTFRLRIGVNNCRGWSVSKVLLALLISAVGLGASSADDEIRSDALFHIERSKNANIVQYDARVTSDGKLYGHRPVVAYWVRLAEQGQIEKLSWLQKTFSYGFDAHLGPEGYTAELDMAVDFDRPITVTRDGEDYRALTVIDGEPAWLERIYVQSGRKGFSKSVEYIDLFGVSVRDGAERQERLNP